MLQARLVYIEHYDLGIKDVITTVVSLKMSSNACCDEIFLVMKRSVDDTNRYISNLSRRYISNLSRRVNSIG